jgi:hypothetical protein
VEAGDDLNAAVSLGLDRSLVNDQLSAVLNAVSSLAGNNVSKDPDQDKDQLRDLLESAASSFKLGDALRAKRLYGDALRLNPVSLAVCLNARFNLR